MPVHTCVIECVWNGGKYATGGILFWRCTFGGVFIACIYLHARWSYRRQLRALLSCPLSVECYYFPLLVNATKLQVQHVVVVAFSSLVRILGECSTIHSPPVLFFFFSLLFQKVEINLCTLTPLFRPGSVHSGSASWDDCGHAFPDELHESSFLNWFPHYAWTAA